MTEGPPSPFPPGSLPAFDDGNRDWITNLWLLAGPTVALMLLVGGVSWIKARSPADAGRDGPDAGVVQVRLLPRPDPSPVPAVPSPRSEAGGVGSAAPEPVNDMRPGTARGAPPDAEEGSRHAAGAVRAPLTAVADPPPSAAAVAFREVLRPHIANYQRYPNAARQKALTGTVTAVISVNRQGRLLGIRIVTSSGEAILDKAAIDTIRRAEPFPAVPATLPDPCLIELSLGFDPP